MLPHITIHNEMSLDGRFDWMLDDSGLYYETINRFKVDAMLSGSHTMLEALKHMQMSEPSKDFKPAAKDFADQRQLLVVVDSQGQITDWSSLRNQPYWRDVVVLCSKATPKQYLDKLREDKIETILAGQDKVDLRIALIELRSEYRVEKIRVDSGGILNGALLRAGLVDEIAVIINPCLAGGYAARTLFVANDLTSRDGVIPLTLIKMEELRDGYLWLQYKVNPA
jgi:2,5-diamino-6-(ribosylamino)-4(3H)-pyrimidinone 5'-phosphate reductase